MNHDFFLFRVASFKGWPNSAWAKPLPYRAGLLSISEFYNAPFPPLSLRGGKRGVNLRGGPNASFKRDKTL